MVQDGAALRSPEWYKSERILAGREDLLFLLMQLADQGRVKKISLPLVYDRTDRILWDEDVPGYDYRVHRRAYESDTMLRHIGAEHLAFFSIVHEFMKGIFVPRDAMGITYWDVINSNFLGINAVLNVVLSDKTICLEGCDNLDYFNDTYLRDGWRFQIVQRVDA